ncbi:MAG: hypothetical protein YHS30scaffold324_57 [Catenulispora phage 69_17]|nr:MAG: hypothetical protein YHS30scaffold324_57 [Catenulispora phage 69_17]
MSALTKRFRLLEAELGADWRRYHVAAQLARLVSGVVGTVLWAVLHGGVSDWTGLVPVATGALWATLAQIWPGVPWLLARRWLRAGRPPAPTGQPGAAP